MFNIIETIATAILLIILMIFVIHLIRGDAGEWLVSKFRIVGIEVDTPSTNTDTTDTASLPIGQTA